MSFRSCEFLGCRSAVFAAGVLNFAASIDATEVSRLVDNVWTRLAQP